MLTKQRLLAAILILISSAVFPQTIEIPAGVTYSYATEETNKNARAVLSTELGDHPKLDLFAGMLLIGPKLWTEIKDRDMIKTISGGNTTFKLPVRNKRGKIVDYQNLKGKLIQKQNDYVIFWNFIKENLIRGEYTFRKLKPSEMEYYWSVISYNITEPVYIVSCNAKNYLFDLEEKEGKLTLLWVDAVD